MKQKNKTLLLRYFLILFILFLGVYLRTINPNWDQEHHLHPDERFLTMVGNKINWPKNLKEYFNTDTSPLNPYNQGYGFFVYGTFPLFLVKKLALILGKDNYQQFNILGRTTSAIFDLGTLVLIGFIAKRIIKKHWLWAFFIYAISVLPIQLSHFFMVDTFLNFFLVATFLFLILFYQKSNKIFLILAGMLLGMALACKITAALFIPIAILFAIISSLKKKGWLFLLINGIVFSLCLFISFHIFQPYAFTDIFHINPQFVANLKELRSHSHNPQSFYPPAIQWIKTKPLLFPGKNIILWGLGAPIGISALISLLFFPIYFFRKEKKPIVLGLSWFWITFLFLYQGMQFSKTMRYFLPLYPSLAIITGNFIGQYLGKIPNQNYRLLLKICLITIFLIWPLSFIRIYLQPHSRVIGSKWIYDNIPQKTTLSCEHWDDCLPLSIEAKNPTSYHYKTEMLPLYDADTNEKWQKINQQLKKIDYLILSSNRLWGSIPKVPEIYPQTTKFYNDLLASRLGFQVIAEITSYPCFPPKGKPFFCIPDQSSEEAFTVYDHPKIIIFKNN